jgi:hypothetical protein
MNLVTPKGGAKHDILHNKPATEARGGFVEHPSPTLAAQQSVTKIISVTIKILVTPKAGAKHTLLLNKTASVEQKLLLSCRFGCDQICKYQFYKFVSFFVALLKSDLDVQQVHLRLLR